MADGLGYRRWMVEENGATLVVLRDESPGAGAIEVPDPWINEVVRQPQAFALQPRADDPARKEVVRRRRVRLSLSGEEFVADDSDAIEFMIIPEDEQKQFDLPVPKAIGFTVNGRRFTVDAMTPWSLASPKPGVFLFKLDDDRVWAKPDERRAEAK